MQNGGEAAKAAQAPHGRLGPLRTETHLEYCQQSARAPLWVLSPPCYSVPVALAIFSYRSPDKFGSDRNESNAWRIKD